MNKAPVKLTQYSHGAGCGCKISPKILDSMLVSQLDIKPDPKLLVGNSSKDDAAAYDLGNGMAVLSTTDFFMPICDDPFDFGRIAATNAISDIYAMGGKPLMAIAILGWPVNKLASEIARQVIDGGRQACMEAGIILAGGHSIDSPEPIFGLAVTGQVAIDQLKQNNTARAGDLLFLTKPLGVGVLTTAQKQGKLRAEHANLARDSMCRLNHIGTELAAMKEVSALTDVTGFGLLGHLLEICEGSGVAASLISSAVPTLPAVAEYIAMGCVPGGTERNFASYGHKVSSLNAEQKALLCDPQTSGGLLVAIRDDPQALEKVHRLFQQHQLDLSPIGSIVNSDQEHQVIVGV
ncbi:selenide, water dikinase SelD [Lacimicrobium alkaliphilum]|uniref:Selenide, water dikinase n=1 Tax=Lacimicrobium alkaliphilum TaxID=1526571 RepID=A0A0U3ALY9_9ALTE|nr:selenide, water dikinase SelD [Lacimicrobium alkaliphilum]ALS99809.1 selenide, water dikinase [Lacimicrobium alkaliphilum]